MNTYVSVEQSREEVRSLLLQASATDVKLLESAGRIRIQFNMAGATYQIAMRTPSNASLQQTWRVAYWYIKRTLEATEFFEEGLSEPFLAHKVLSNGRTTRDELRATQGSLRSLRALTAG